MNSYTQGGKVKVKLLISTIMVWALLVVSISYAGSPQAIIFSPEEGATFQNGMEIHFSGNGFYPATDSESVLENLVWHSSLDGQIGVVEEFLKTLSVGVHLITLEVIGSTGDSASMSITIRVVE